MQQLRQRSVRAEEGGEDSLPLSRPLEHGGPGAIAKEHGRRAILPVDDRTQLFGSHDKRGVRVAAHHQAFGYDQAVQPTGAGAETSKAAAREAPSSACSSTAVAGSRWSGDAVPNTMRSISPGCTPARSIATRDAAADMVRLFSVGPAMRRSRMPVRCTIHSSLVSSPIAANS